VVDFNPSEYSIVFDLHGVLVDTTNFLKVFSQKVAEYIEADFAIPTKATMKKHAEAHPIWKDDSKKHHELEGSDLIRASEKALVNWVTHLVGTIDWEAALDYGKRLQYLIPSSGDYTYAGTKEILTKLHKMGFNLFIASNAPYRHVVGIVQGASIESLFQGVYGRDNLGSMKSKKQFFKHLLEKIDSQANRTLMVGNSINEILHPSDLGFTTILVHRESEIPPDIRSKANIEIMTLEDLLPKILDYFKTKSKK
jgi:FMN phosphatase YigB (HAD superfamily)